MNRLSPVLFAALCASATGEPVPEVSIYYDHAGLTQVKIEKGRLHYVWHAPRHYDKNKLVPARQDMSAYDRYEAHLWLTDEEVGSLRKWAHDYKILEMPTTFQEKLPKTYGAAFETVLSVTLGERKHSMAWTGESQVSKELMAAVSALTGLCEQIYRSRQEATSSSEAKP